MALFGTKSSGGDGNSVNRDPRKAQRFFEHAETVADAKNFDYAIEMYISGLRHDPDNMAKHEALLDVAKRRKVNGGKPAGLKEKLKSLGPSEVDKMLHAEKLWVMNFVDVGLMLELMEKSVQADEAEPELALGEVTVWVGTILLEFADPKPKVKKYTTMQDCFAAVGRYDKAVEACKRAIRLEPGNADLMAKLKDLEAENYSATSSSGRSEAGGFHGNVKDVQEAAASAGGHTASAREQRVAAARKGWEENPEDLDQLTKLVDTLVQGEVYESETEAIKLLHKAHEQSGQYRYRMRAADVQSKLYNRELRELRDFIRAAPEEEDYQNRYKQLLVTKLNFELQEYAERVKQYPTDLKAKFELGKRLFQGRKFDEAIGMLQQAKAEPKSRSQAHLLLGRCFLEKEWFDEAVDTFNQGIEIHQVADDALAKELRYELAVTLLGSAQRNNSLEQAQEANRLASDILQADINYKDIRAKKEAANELVKQLKES